MRPATSNTVAAIKMRYHYAANKEQCKARCYAWRAANPEKWKAIQLRSYERRKARLAISHA